MPDTTIGSADDYFSDELLGEVEDDTPMKKMQLFEEYETPSKKAMNFLDSRKHRHFLVLQQKNCRRILRKQRLL
jgi:hypothetical protein